MGIFAGLNAEKYDRQYSDRELLRRILQYIKPHASKLVGIALTVLLISGAGAMQPVVVSRGVDLMNTQPGVNAIFVLSGAVMLIGVTSWFANWGRRRLTVRTIADVLMKLANDAFKAAAEHDLSFYDQFSSARVQSRITSDTRDFGNLITMTTDLVSQVAEAMILGVILVRNEWRLALILFALIPVVFLMAISYRNLARTVTRKGMQATANVNLAIKETVSGIGVAKNFRQESGVYAEFSDANVTSYKVNVRRGLVLSLVFPTLNTIGGIMSAVLVYFGGLSAAQGIVTAGAWYLFLQSLDRFLFPVMSLSSFWTQVQSGLSAAERVFALIDAEPAVVQNAHHHVGKLAGRIQFEHVNFRYKESEPVLQDFTLDIQPGENVALVGHTGAGKSSIAKLIARFYEFQGGRILIDGRDIRSLDLVSFRRQLGIVSQVPFLFSGTVLDNIRYACQVQDGVSPCDEDIEALARQIGGGEWVETLPEGLRSEVGERGARLSMGQRQLVSLMRVLVQQPSIFVLDEATASIDPFTEWQIQQALNMILAETTSILIAHRLSTVRSANRIVVMEQGRILQTGTHEGLLAAGGHYATLYNTYFRHQSLAYVEESRLQFGLDEADNMVGRAA